MSIRTVSMERGGDIIIIDGREIYRVEAVDRTTARTSKALRQKLNEGKTRPLSEPVAFHIDARGNEYTIVGPQIGPLPGEEGDR